METTSGYRVDNQVQSNIELELNDAMISRERSINKYDCKAEPKHRDMFVYGLFDQEG